jgi:hypothetical protein
MGFKNKSIDVSRQAAAKSYLVSFVLTPIHQHVWPVSFD